MKGGRVVLFGLWRQDGENDRVPCRERSSSSIAFNATLLRAQHLRCAWGEIDLLCLSSFTVVLSTIAIVSVISLRMGTGRRVAARGEPPHPPRH